VLACHDYSEDCCCPRRAAGTRRAVSRGRRAH
jgi:hypothetical protein